MILVATIWILNIFDQQPALCSVGESASLPSIQKARLEASVSLDPQTRIYRYEYRLWNDTSDTGHILRMKVDIAKPEGGQDLSATGLVDGPGGGGLSPGKMGMTKVDYIPVGMSAPDSWRASVDVRGRFKCGAIRESGVLLPGRSLSGFALASPGLPGMRAAVLEPRYPPPSEEDPHAMDYVHEVERTVFLHTTTLGPTAPPKDFVPVAFLEYLIGLKDQSATLGWIDSPGVVNSLNVKLKAALRDLKRGRRKAAIGTLRAFVQEVRAQEGKHLKPEAAGLLGYNAEYLISRL